MSSKGNSFHSSNLGHVQAAVDRAIIKASLMGILDDTNNKKAIKKANKKAQKKK